MTGAKSLNMEFNLRNKGWSIMLDGEDLRLTAVSLKQKQMTLTGQVVLPQFRKQDPEEVLSFVQDFRHSHGLKRADAVLTLPRSRVILETVELPLETEATLDESLSYQLGNYFPMDLDNYQFHSQIIHRGEKLKVMVVAIENAYMAAANSWLDQWDTKVAVISLDSFELFNGLSRCTTVDLLASQTMIFRPSPAGLEMIGIRSGKLVMSYFQKTDLEDDIPVAFVEEGFAMARMDPNEVDHYFWFGEGQEEVHAWLRDAVEIPFDAGSLPQLTAAQIPGFTACTRAIFEKTPLSCNFAAENRQHRHKLVPVLAGWIALAAAVLFFVLAEVKEMKGMVDRHARLEQQVDELRDRMMVVGKARADMNLVQEELSAYQKHRATKLFLSLTRSLASDLPEHTFIEHLKIDEYTKVKITGESDDPYSVSSILDTFPFLKEVELVGALQKGKLRKNRFVYKARIDIEVFVNDGERYAQLGASH